MTHKKTLILPPILFLEILNPNENPIFDKLICTLPPPKPTKKSINTTLCSSILIRSQQFHNSQISDLFLLFSLYNNAGENANEKREKKMKKEDETPEKRRVHMYLDLDAIEDYADEEEDDEDDFE